MSIRIPEEWPKESEILKTSKQTLENNSETTVQTLIISCEVKVAQSCPTLCDPMGYSPPVTSVHGNLQARILMRVAISYFRGSSWHRGRTQFSCIAGRFFTIWATREVQSSHMQQLNSKVPCSFLIYLYQVCKLVQSLGKSVWKCLKIFKCTYCLISKSTSNSVEVHRDTQIWAQKYLYKDIHWNPACLSIRKWLKKKWLNKLRYGYKIT